MLRSIFAGAVALLALMPAARADDAAPQSRLDRIIAAGVLKVGSTGDYKPFTYKDPSTGKFSGFDIDLADSLAKALGGGIPCGAVGGTAEVMSAITDGRYDQVGTFNGNPLTMAAAKAYA